MVKVSGWIKLNFEMCVALDIDTYIVLNGTPGHHKISLLPCNVTLNSAITNFCFFFVSQDTSLRLLHLSELLIVVPDFLYVIDCAASFTLCQTSFHLLFRLSIVRYMV